MIITFQVIVTIFVTLGVFIFIQMLVRLVSESGWAQEIYIKYVRAWFVDRAYRKEEKFLIDEETYLTKLAQLSARRHKDRGLALDYFDNVPTDRRLAKKLIEIIPRQHNLDIQKRMACLLCRTLADFTVWKNKNLAQDQSAQSPKIGGTIKEWRIAISIWLSEIILAVLLGFNVVIFSIEQLLFLGLTLLMMMVVGLIIVIKDWRRVGKVTLLAIAFFLAGLWFFSKEAHCGTSSIVIENLASYGIANVGIHINHPGWLTADDIGTINKSVTVSVIGHNAVQTDTLTLLFQYDRTILELVDKNGNLMSAQLALKTDNPGGAPEVFYVRPLDHNALKKTTSTQLIPQIETGPMIWQSIPELGFFIQLENPTWKIVRDLASMYSFPFSGTVLAGMSFLWFLWDRVTKKS
ncbi:MAG: hypothetical protein JW953_02735 [Anaerolineae bacterium]|nr:hypothetical protein [Anaerolineae bacterium]